MTLGMRLTVPDEPAESFRCDRFRCQIGETKQVGASKQSLLKTQCDHS